MARRFTMRKVKKMLRRLFTKEGAFMAVSVLLLGAFVVFGIIQTRLMIDPTAYKPLLTTIAQGESLDNYNAYFANAGNQEIKFTRMTLAEVIEWQKAYVREGSPSNAIGRYQIIQPTLEGLIKEYNLDTKLVFDEALQDKLAIALMERRGSIDFMKGNLSAEEFAHNLSKEWAALPRVIGDDPERSYYAGDGLNASHISSDAILSAINQFKQRAEEK